MGSTASGSAPTGGTGPSQYNSGTGTSQYNTGTGPSQYNNAVPSTGTSMNGTVNDSATGGMGSTSTGTGTGTQSGNMNGSAGVGTR
jgi:hypothetical protein